MTFPDLFERFARRHLPAGLSAVATVRFRSLARADAVQRDRRIALDGDRDHLVYVGSGATKLVAHASGGREQIVAFHFPDELVAVPRRAEHAYTLESVAAGEVLVFDYADFADLARSEPAVLRTLLDCARKSLGRCREKSLALGRKTATERLAGFLVGMAARIGAPDEGVVAIDLPMSRRDIADSLGLTIETVSRQFTCLRDAGIVATFGKAGVRVRDMRALEARAGFLLEACDGEAGQLIQIKAAREPAA